MKSRILALAFLSSLFAAAMLQPAAAGNPRLNVRLGLWEVTSVAQTSGNLPYDMGNLSPEQRAKVEAMMTATRKRMAQPHTFRSCLTEGKLEKDLFQDNKNDSCKQSVVSRTSSAYDVRFDCRDERGGETSGEWKFEAENPELVKGSGQMTMQGAAGKMQSASTITAKWIGASCGNVK
jgi:hypothetical protein